MHTYLTFFKEVAIFLKSNNSIQELLTILLESIITYLKVNNSIKVSFAIFLKSKNFDTRIIDDVTRKHNSIVESVKLI